MTNFAKVRGIIDGDSALSVAFVDVKDDTKAEDNPTSDAALVLIEAHFEQLVVKYNDITVPAAASVWEVNNVTEKLMAGTSHSTDNVAKSCKKLMRIVSLESAANFIHYSREQDRTNFDARLGLIVDAGVISQADADMVTDLGTGTQKVWQEKKCGSVVGRGVILLLKSGRA